MKAGEERPGPIWGAWRRIQDRFGLGRPSTAPARLPISAFVKPPHAKRDPARNTGARAAPAGAVRKARVVTATVPQPKRLQQQQQSPYPLAAAAPPVGVPPPPAPAVPAGSAAPQQLSAPATPPKPSVPSVILAPKATEGLQLAAPPPPPGADAEASSVDLNALLKRKGPNPNQTLIFDHRGALVASLNEGQNRHQVPLGEIAAVLQQAVVACEDARFYSHVGVDPRGLARAILYRGRAGGGSTITQQLAKNLFLSFDRSVSRKITEVMLAVQLEKRFTKKQILEMYLNRIYWGHGAYGIESASRKYFNKPARELTLPEAALLAGIIPGPEYFSPYRNPDLGKRQQLRALERMVASGQISPAQAAAAAKATITLAGNPDEPYRAPYFVSEVLAQLCSAFGSDAVFRGGLRVRTTLDLPMQEAAEAAVRGVKPPAQAALVAIQPGTGAVRAMVGGTSWARSQYNRATQSRRQAGSTFKPVVYLAAFEEGLNPLSTVVDEPVSFGKYRPQNADRKHRGRVTFEAALANSLNVPTVRVANTVGMAKVQRLAKELGILSPLPGDLSGALGSGDVGITELATAYATIAADGRRAETHMVTRVEDRDGRCLYDVSAHAAPPRPVAAPSSAAALHHCLQAVISGGTGRGAGFGRPAAGKTGTTDNCRDALFAGYTPDLACVVWLGNDDNKPLGGYGGTLAAPVWRQFMAAAHKSVPPRAFPPANLVPEPPPPPPPAPSPTPALEAAPGGDPSPKPAEGQAAPAEAAPSQPPLAPAPAPDPFEAPRRLRRSRRPPRRRPPRRRRRLRSPPRRPPRRHPPRADSFRGSCGHGPRPAAAPRPAGAPPPQPPRPAPAAAPRPAGAPGRPAAAPASAAKPAAAQAPAAATARPAARPPAAAGAKPVPARAPAAAIQATRRRAAFHAPLLGRRAPGPRFEAPGWLALFPQS
eukprot:tig00000670_g3048.t1